jgi:hypothetical protein
VLPLAAALVLVSAVVQRARLVGAFSCAVGVIGLASVAVVLASADTSQPGPPIAAGAAVLAVSFGVRLLVRRSTRVRHH